jgi:D-alanine-D-alanine ligase
MAESKKINIAVLFGGRSSEHEISILSAQSIIQNLDKDRFEAVPIGISKQGIWYLSQNDLVLSQPQLTLSTDQDYQLFAPDLLGKQPLQVASSKVLSQLNHRDRLFDVIFPAIHGPLCEDGTVQGLLELVDVP